MRIAFLSMASLDGHVADDDLAIPFLSSRGVVVETVPWRAPDVPWETFDLVVVRSTWDYHRSPDEFLHVLERIASATRLANALPVVRWNLDKRYLEELEEAGVPVVPTRFVRVDGASDLADAITSTGAGDRGVVVKPTVSASADRTFRLAADELWAERVAGVAKALDGLVAMVQPFVSEIVTHGEVSLFYFGNDFSHAVRKTPRPGDYRVQEEHGGRIERIDAGPRLRRVGRQVLDAAPFDPPLYSRVDVVQTDGSYHLMELELIEPALYLRTDASAPATFARALIAAAKMRRG